MPQSSKYTLKPSLKKKFKGIIWRIETDEARQEIAIETRDPETRSVYFSVCNYQTGKIWLDEISGENEAWWNMDRLHGHTLFLHGYVHEKTPEHKGICAIDISSGKMKWQNFQLALEDIAEEGLIAFNPLIQPKKLQLISPENGQTMSFFIQNYSPIRQNIHFPQVFSDSSLLPEFIPENTFGPVFFIEHRGKECWAFHIKNQDSFSQHLIVSEKGIIVLTDILASDIQKLNPEAFFIQQNHIFYVKDQNKEIASYLL